MPQQTPNRLRDAYFSSSNARLYIDDGNWSEMDINNVQWTAGQSHSPVYSVSSTLWDNLMAGQYIARGGFRVNLRNSTELQRLLAGEASGSLEFPSFNMVVQFVLDFNPNATPLVPTYLFRRVYATSISGETDPSGEPIAENYEFFAQRVTELEFEPNELAYILKNRPTV